MDILSLINSNLKFKRIVKDQLFYDQYQYCMGFHLAEISCLRELNHDYIDTIIERRRQWRTVELQRWNNSSPSNQTILARRVRDITDDTVANLHKVTDVLLNTTVQFKLVTSVSNAWVYTNDVALIQQLSELPFLISKTYTQSIIDRPKNTIKLQSPNHTHRTYFKSVKLSEVEKTQLCNFFTSQHESIRISPSLEKWMLDSFHRTQDYFFIDHNGEGWLIMLSLVNPGMIRKTVNLIAA